MTTINSRACVVNGTPVDKVFSDGKQVYGRNLLTGTKYFSGSWDKPWGWGNDGTYKGLTVKKKTEAWNGINKIFTAPKDGVYTFSAYVKSSGNNANIIRYPDSSNMGNNFDWLRDSFTTTLKAGQTIYTRYEITGAGADSILWTAGHKWEQGSTATPWSPAPEDVM